VESVSVVPYGSVDVWKVATRLRLDDRERLT
jgi:hypothetical protein